MSIHIGDCTAILALWATLPYDHPGMVDVNVLLQRQHPDGSTTPWQVNADGTDPVSDAALLAQATGRGLYVDTVQNKWRSDFNSTAAMNNKWDITPAPGGVAPAVAAGLMTFGTGVVSGEETILLSKQTFSIPCRYLIGIAISQKIANQQFRVEFVSVDPLTGIPYPAGDINNHTAAWYLANPDTATQGRLERTSGGLVVLDPAVTTIVTNVGATVTQIEELILDNDCIRGYQKPINASGARVANIIRHDNLPDPNAVYKLRIRATNTGVPASSTTVTVSFASVVDYNEMVTEISAGQGQPDAGTSVPVQVNNSPSVTATMTSTTIAAPAATIAGTTPFKILSAATTNATSVKTTAARLLGGVIGNTTAAWKFLKIYNKASAPTVGTDIPVFTIPIPPNGAISLRGTLGVTMATGLAFAITGGSADLDTTVTAVGDVVGYLEYV